MSLMDFVEDPPPVALIKQRRLQVLVHSAVYYEFDETVVSDETFDRWSQELVELLEKYPDAYSDEYDYYFRDWDGSSGYHFPHRDNWVYAKAEWLIKERQAGRIKIR